MNSIRAILILLLLCCNGLLQAQNEQFLVPEDLYQHEIYVKKFSPIYIKDISGDDLKRIEGEDPEENMSDFVGFLNYYNAVLYRKLNEQIESTLDQLNHSSKFKPMYLRDFNESQDSSIKYIINNNYSMIEAFIMSRDRQYNEEIGFYIEEKEGSKIYKSEESISTLLSKIDLYFDLVDRGALSSMTRIEIEEKLENIKAAKNKSGGTNWALTTALVSGIMFILNFVLT